MRAPRPARTGQRHRCRSAPCLRLERGRAAACLPRASRRTTHEARNSGPRWRPSSKPQRHDGCVRPRRLRVATTRGRRRVNLKFQVQPLLPAARQSSCGARPRATPPASGNGGKACRVQRQPCGRHHAAMRRHLARSRPDARPRAGGRSSSWRRLACAPLDNRISAPIIRCTAPVKITHPPRRRKRCRQTR